MFFDLIALFAVCLLTYAITSFVLSKKTNNVIGNLRIDNSDPNEPPYLFLELEKTPDRLKDGDKVVLIVKVKNYISQK